MDWAVDYKISFKTVNGKESYAGTEIDDSDPEVKKGFKTVNGKESYAGGISKTVSNVNPFQNRKR